MQRETAFAFGRYVLQSLADFRSGSDFPPALLAYFTRERGFGRLALFNASAGKKALSCLTPYDSDLAFIHDDGVSARARRVAAAFNALTER